MSAKGAQTADEPAYEKFERGDVVTYTYESDGETKSARGVVVKSNRGGTRVLALNARRRPLRNFRLECGGHVISNNREGNGHTMQIGENASVEKTGDTRSVRYKQHRGWFVEGE